jgi:putative transposase
MVCSTTIPFLEWILFSLFLPPITIVGFFSFVAERFISSLINRYGKHSVSTDGGTWYPQACRFLKVEHHTHSDLEKSLIERTMHYIKDRTKGFDDYYFPCKRKKNKCKLKHVKQWFSLFIDQHNKEIIS